MIDSAHNAKLPPRGSAVHVVGVAGVGMNAIAQVLQARGYRVSGSDRLKDQGGSSPLLDRLENQGIALHPQDGSAIGAETDAVIISSAIEPDNPEWIAARAFHVPVLHRAEALAAVIGSQRCVAIAGTSGKTTITGMAGWLLTELGMEPNVVNGGPILNWKSRDGVGNVRMTTSDTWVIEVDESDRSLLCFHPEYAIISNITRDHFPLEETVDLFATFMKQVRHTLVLGPGVTEHLNEVRNSSVRWVEAPAPAEWTTALPLPGRHNRENAQLAVTLCEVLGFDREEAMRALTRFKGIERRLECVGEGGGLAVYDDYAHNPAKIHAAWTAVADNAASVHAVWRPHGYGPLAAMADDLVAMFCDTCRENDRLYVLPVYYAGGTTEKALTSEAFVGQLIAAGVPAEYMPDYDALAKRLDKNVSRGSAILCMGARDPDLPVFARRVSKDLIDANA